MPWVSKARQRVTTCVVRQCFSRSVLAANKRTAYSPLWRRPHWKAACGRFAGLEDAPAGVQTAMLSLTYNRGARNKRIGHLVPLICNGDWNGLAHAIGSMQQNHKLSGIRKRRRLEARIIYQDQKEVA